MTSLWVRENRFATLMLQFNCSKVYDTINIAVSNPSETDEIRLFQSCIAIVLVIYLWALSMRILAILGI